MTCALVSERGRRDKAANPSYHELGEARRMVLGTGHSRRQLPPPLSWSSRPANARLFTSAPARRARHAVSIVPESSRQKGKVTMNSAYVGPRARRLAGGPSAAASPDEVVQQGAVVDQRGAHVFRRCRTLSGRGTSDPSRRRATGLMPQCHIRWRTKLWLPAWSALAAKRRTVRGRN